MLRNQSLAHGRSEWDWKRATRLLDDRFAALSSRTRATATGRPLPHAERRRRADMPWHCGQSHSVDRRWSLAQHGRRPREALVGQQRLFASVRLRRSGTMWRHHRSTAIDPSSAPPFRASATSVPALAHSQDPARNNGRPVAGCFVAMKAKESKSRLIH